MKRCSYCGRDNSTAAKHCHECGTGLALNTARTCPDNTKPTAKARLVLTSALGSFLILSALLWAILRAAFDLAAAGVERPISQPGVYGVGILAFIYALPFLLAVIAVGLPAMLGVCLRRCQDGFSGATAWALSTGVLLAVLLVNELRLLVPAVWLGRAFNSPAAGYIAAALQTGLGVWLLGGGRWKPYATVSSGQG